MKTSIIALSAAPGGEASPDKPDPGALDLSVIIPTFNRGPILTRTLKALAQQTFPAGKPAAFEVIVVDDGSTDDTSRRVSRMTADLPSLHYLRQENKKQGAARNRGARSARGEILVFLGDDTVPKTDFLAEHLSSHAPGPESLAVIGYTPWASEYRITRFMKHIAEQGWQFGFAIIEDPDDVPFNFLYTSNLSLRRQAFLQAGGFDEDFQEYGWEDIELGWRLKKMGVRIAYNPRAVARHHHPTSMRSFLRRQRKVGFSAWTFYRKHPEMADFLNLRHPPRRSLRRNLKMGLLKVACLLTERLDWPDLSRHYPDLLSHHYNLGLLKASDERR